jgi:hypothetical protein
MGYAELIEKLQALPSEKQAEVFDFVEFLAARFGKAKPLAHDDWNDAEFAEFSMGQALRGMEDEPVLYTRDDLKERWQCFNPHPTPSVE